MSENLRQLAKQIYPGSRVVSSRRLPGGVSAQVTAFELELEGGARKELVLRQYGNTDVASNPDVAGTEYELLKRLHLNGLLVPEPHFYDSSGRRFPGPILVTDFVEGESLFDPPDIDAFLEQLTAQLLTIHQAGGGIGDLSFLPQREPLPPTVLSERLLRVDAELSIDEVGHLLRIKRAPAGNDATLLHGDYWPGNVLWRNGQVVAVIDWEDARTGDPLADIANCRLELLWSFGNTGMERFTERYQAESDLDFTSLPYWDLCVAVGAAATYASWTDDETVTEGRRQRFHWFIGQALKQALKKLW